MEHEDAVGEVVGLHGTRPVGKLIWQSPIVSGALEFNDERFKSCAPIPCPSFEEIMIEVAETSEIDQLAARAYRAFAAQLLEPMPAFEDLDVNVRIGWWEAVKQLLSDTENTCKKEHMTHHDTTLKKVYDAMMRFGITDQQCIDAIFDMQNNGIYFREAR